jgi:hypothetical protein
MGTGVAFQIWSPERSRGRLVDAARLDNQFVVIGCSRHSVSFENNVSLENAAERLIKVVKHSSVSTG